MINKRNGVGLVFLVFFIGSCLKTPEWVDKHQTTQFPPSRYITAVGSGNSRKSAENDAMAAIARIFETKVTSESTDMQSSSRSRENKSKEKTRNAESAAVQTKVSTQKILTGVEIKGIYKANRNLYFALAVIDKRKRVDALSAQIAELDLSIEQQMKSVHDEATSHFEKWRHWRYLLPLLKKRHELNQELVLFIDSATPVPSMEVDTYEDEYRAFVTKELVLVVTSTGDEATFLNAMVSQVVSDLGLTVQKREVIDSKVDVHIETDLRMTVMPKHDDWIVVQWILTLTVRNPKTSTTLTTLSLSGSESQLNLEKAKSKVLAVVRQKLTDELPAKLQ